MTHVPAMAAFLANALPQAPIVVQCSQPAPESWLKWLLPTIVQTVVSLLSIAAGVLIAVWSFRRNRQTEHEQFVRDQKRAEWKEIVKAVSQIEEAIPAVARIQEKYDAVSQSLPKLLSQLLAVRGSAVFISQALDRQEMADVFESFVRSGANAAEFLQGFNAQSETDPAVRESCRTKYAEIRDEYLRFWSRIKSEARKDLGIVTPSS